MACRGPCARLVGRSRGHTGASRVVFSEGSWELSAGPVPELRPELCGRPSGVGRLRLSPRIPPVHRGGGAAPCSCRGRRSRGCARNLPWNITWASTPSVNRVGVRARVTRGQFFPMRTVSPSACSPTVRCCSDICWPAFTPDPANSAYLVRLRRGAVDHNFL